MKALVVGHGPSHSNIDFIKKFDGIIISCDRTARDMVSNGIIPDYITFHEIQNDWVKEVLEFLPDSFSKIKSTVIYRAGPTDFTIVEERASKLGLKSSNFEVDSYVNNVGLYSVIFAIKALGIKELHLIGLDHVGGKQHENIPYSPFIFDEWVETFRQYLTVVHPICDIIDHSNGRLKDLLLPYYNGK